MLTCADHVTPLGWSCPGGELVYFGAAAGESYRGAAARCWLERVFTSPDHPGVVRVVTVNAHDAGLAFVHLDARRSENVASSANPRSVVNAAHSLRCFYHVGQYGVNNISPADPDGWVTLRELTARTTLSFKLWRERPSSPDDPPDFRYEVSVDLRS